MRTENLHQWFTAITKHTGMVTLILSKIEFYLFFLELLASISGLEF